MTQVTDAINRLTTAVDNLAANLPTGGSSDDAANAALIDAQTARVSALESGTQPAPAVRTALSGISTVPVPGPVGLNPDRAVVSTSPVQTVPTPEVSTTPQTGTLANGTEVPVTPAGVAGVNADGSVW